jgi:predicted AAA+ superfamily ATPase
MEFINRDIAAAIIATSPHFPVITITGPRQSGKTTLCKNLFPDRHYVNLETLATREQIMRDPVGFLDNYPTGLIIDEVHNYPELFSHIQVSVDEHPDRKYVLTGSSNFLLLEKITQSLAGRTALFTLLPFSIKELGALANETSTDTLLLNGGYPAVWARKTPVNMFASNYYTTYVERDVRQIVNIKDMKSFQIFIRLTAGRIGTECNSTTLSNETGVSVNTVRHWLSVLEASYVIYTLPPYYENISKRLVKSPKIYFHDTALACYLLGIENEMHLKAHPLRGSLFENMVINEAMKECRNAGKDASLFFFRDRTMKEVDLLHLCGRELNIYEIKSAKTYNRDFYKGIDYLTDILGERITRSALIFDGDAEIHSVKNGAYNFRNFCVFTKS